METTLICMTIFMLQLGCGKTEVPVSVPRNLTLEPVEGAPLSVFVKWQPPVRSEGEITGYLVYYTTDPKQHANHWTVNGVVGSRQFITIADLMEDTTYYFKVQARNYNGYGPMSSAAIYKTPKVKTTSLPVIMKHESRARSEEEMSVPVSIPRHLTFEPVEGAPLSVFVKWQPPVWSDGEITGYIVFYTTDPNQHAHDWVVEGVIGTRQNITIADLMENTTYYFKVQARNNNGYGPMSSAAIYKTPKVLVKTTPLPVIMKHESRASTEVEMTGAVRRWQSFLVLVKQVIALTRHFFD